MKRSGIVYIAGPEVFLPDAVEIGRRKKALCAQYGFLGLFPFDAEIDLNTAEDRPDHVIYRNNIDMIGRCDLGICNLTPFCGVSADAGTVFELGMLAGLDKPVFGYSNDTADFLKRHADARKVGDGWRDAAGMTIENFGNADNLMIDACLALQGHGLVRVEAPVAEKYRDLRGFEACLELARREAEVHQRGRG